MTLRLSYHTPKAIVADWVALLVGIISTSATFT